MKKTIKKNFILLILILLFAFLLRTFLIGRIPPSLSNDEVDYLYDSWSVAKTGRDLLGKSLPLSFVTDQKMSPVPVYWTALFLIFLPLNIFSCRLAFAVSGLIAVFLTYLLAKEMFQSSKISLLSALLLAISPWHLQLSRVAYDANLALCFYLLAVYLFLKERIFLSLGPFLLAYYSYHGTKVLFFPLIIVLFYYKLVFLRKNKAKAVVFLFLSLAVFASFYFVGRDKQGLERVGQLLFFDHREAAKFVNYERRTSSASQLVKKVFNNKLLYYFRTIKERYFAYFNFLFNNGEESGLYSLWFRGNQYFADLFFFITGFYYLYRQKKKKKAYFLTLLLLVSVFPAALSSGKSSFGTRALVGLPFLIIILALGIDYFLSWFKRKKIIIIFLLSGYCCLLASYLYQYYFRYPLYGAESWHYSDQQAINYLIGQQEKRQKIIITHYHFPILARFGLSRKVDPQKIQAMADKKISNLERDIKFENIEFYQGCPYKKQGNPFHFLPDNSVLITKWDWDCYSDIPATKEIRAQDDGRVMWRIYEKN